MRPDYYRVEVRARVPGAAGKVAVDLECFDLIDAMGGDFYLGNAFKYLWRAGRKPGAVRREDLAKAITYLRQVMEHDEHDEKTRPPVVGPRPLSADAKEKESS